MSTLDNNSNTNSYSFSSPLNDSYDLTPARKYAKGIGEAVADRTINRIKPDGTKEIWADVARRVALGNSLLGPNHQFEFTRLHHHLRQASLLMSGRHLQHGDEDQPKRNLEVFTNCSTAACTFLTFYLLLNGSGVGRSYDDSMILVDYREQPIVVPVIDMSHKDSQSGEINCLDLRNAQHLYAHKKITVFEVPDTREGWAKSLEKIEVMAFEKRHEEVLILDFTKVRPRGSPIAGMQNRPASGPGPLIASIKNIAMLREAGMPAWRSAMYADHYVAECVLVGGARRAARMATKYWKDSSIFDFISLKRGGFLWSSNNSVMVDKEFWDYVKADESQFAFHGPETFKLLDHAKAVFKAVTEAAYFDKTGEPGLINVDRLTWNPKDIETLFDGNYAESERYKLDGETLELTSRLAMSWASNQYKTITNPCVSGDTPILTKQGYIPIEETIGKKIEVWNGKEFSEVTPFSTGFNPTLRIEFSNGVELRCTPYHKFVLKGDRYNPEGPRVEAKDLKIGDSLAKYAMPVIEAGNNYDGTEKAYSQGFYSGDGSTDLNFSLLYEPKYACESRLIGSFGEKHNSSARKTWTHGKMRPKNWVPLDGSAQYCVEWLAGLLDSDGVVCTDIEGGQSFQIASIDKQFLANIRLMLTRLGVNATYALSREVCNQLLPDGKGRQKEYFCQELWRLVICGFDSWTLVNSLGLRLNRLSYTARKPNHSAARFITVTAVHEDEPCETFCFTEPKNHTGTFNGIVTANCGEIVLGALGGYCVIADVVPYYASSDDDAEEAFRVATRALIRTNTMDSLYSKEVHRTNRIGVGMTGIHEYAWARFGFGWKDIVNEEVSRPFWLMLSRFKRAIQEEAREYSIELGVSVPHTDSTMKPAGTTAKLFGLTEGAHTASMREFVRWVQFRNDDPLIAEYKAKGYPIRELRTYSGTTIVGFPTTPLICTLGMGNKLVTAAEATPEEQYTYLCLLEKYYIVGVQEDGVTPLRDTGNQVSYTLKYDPTVLSFETFQKTLLEGQSKIRCCSVMPQSDTSAYEYQPEQPVSKHEFEMIAKSIETEMKEDIGFEHVDCANGACPIDFSRGKE